MSQQDFNDLIEYLEEIPCSECGGEGFCDYGFGEDVRTMACEECNADNEPDEDQGRDR